MNEECDHETIRTGSMKELKEALRRHGERTGSTREATEAWRSYGSIRNGEHVEDRTLNEEEV